MKINKVIITLLVISLLAVGFLGAAGVAERSPEKPVIEVWYGGPAPQMNLVKKAASDYNASQNRVTIVVNETPASTQAIAAALAGGQGPDLMFYGQNFAWNFGDDAFYSLVDFVNDPVIGLDSSEFFPSQRLAVNYGGEVVAVPVRFNLGAVQYNRRLVAEAGLDENNPPKTWAEMEEWAKALTKVENGRVTQIGLTAETIDWMLQEVMFANGGDWVNSTLTEYAPDVDALVGGLAWMDRLVNDLKVMNIPASVAWTGTTDNLEGGRQSLASETAAMLIGYSSPGTVLSMNPDLDIALFPIPKGPLGEGKPVKISTGYDGWHVVQPAKNPREAYLFAKFFVENFSQEYALAAYSFPARAKSLDSYRNDPMYAKMVDHLLESPVRNFHVFPARLDVRSEEPTMVQNVLARRATPAAAVRTFKQHADRVFAQNKSVLETFASRHGLVW